MSTPYISIVIIPKPGETSVAIRPSTITYIEMGHARLQFSDSDQAAAWLAEVIDARTAHPDAVALGVQVTADDARIGEPIADLPAVPS